MSNEYTQRDYWATVNGIAEDALHEHVSNDGDTHDYVWESVDGSAWIIYTHANLKAIEFSATDASETEWHAYVKPDATWSDITAVVAFCCMLEDVNEALSSLMAEHEVA